MLKFSRAFQQAIIHHQISKDNTEWSFEDMVERRLRTFTKLTSSSRVSDFIAEGLV